MIGAPQDVVISPLFACFSEVGELISYNLVGLGSEPLGGNIVCYTRCQARNTLII